MSDPPFFRKPLHTSSRIASLLISHLISQVMIGNYTYLDGDLHVKLALCADYCIQKLRKARPSTGVAFLCTPTDIHVCTEASDRAARDNYGSGFGERRAGRPL